MTTPRTHAIRYRIWAYASPREWDVTIPEIAEALGIPTQVVQGTVQHAGWLGRVRGVSAGHHVGGQSFGQRSIGRLVAADLASGRIGNGVAV